MSVQGRRIDILYVVHLFTTNVSLKFFRLDQASDVDTFLLCTKGQRVRSVEEFLRCKLNTLISYVISIILVLELGQRAQSSVN